VLFMRARDPFLPFVLHAKRPPSPASAGPKKKKKIPLALGPLCPARRP